MKSVYTPEMRWSASISGYSEKEICRLAFIINLNTLRKKPSAVRNSVALKSIPRLKAIFDTYYSRQPKKFIERFLENKELLIAWLEDSKR